MSRAFPIVPGLARRALDTGADSRISAAAADVPGHGGVDVGVGRFGLGGEQRGGGHDLAGLAIATLRNLELVPGLLNPFTGDGGANGLDRGDALVARCGNRRHARAHGLAVEVYRARAAQGAAAAE